MLQQELHKGRLETSGKMPARNPADKVHYTVQGLVTYPFSDFDTQSILILFHLIALSRSHIFPAKEWEIFLLLHESHFHFIREKPSLSQQCLCHLIQ